MEIQFNLEHLAGLLGKPADEIAEALKEGEDLKPPEDVVAWLKKSIDDRLYAEKREVRDQHYSRGKKEALTAKERELMQKYGLEGSYDLEGLIDHLVDEAKKAPDMDPEAVRNHEIFKAEIEKRDRRISELSESLKSTQEEYRQRQIDAAARKRGMQLLEDNNFVLPDGVVDPDIWMDVLFSRLSGKDAQLSLTEDGDLVVLDANGQPKTDDRTVEPVTFDRHFVSVAKKLFKVAQSDDRKSPAPKPGDPPGGGGAGASEDFAPIKDADDFMERLAGMDPGKQKKFIEFYEKQQQGS